MISNFRTATIFQEIHSQSSRLIFPELFDPLVVVIVLHCTDCDGLTPRY